MEEYMAKKYEDTHIEIRNANSEEEIIFFIDNGYKYLYDTEKPKEYDEKIYNLKSTIVEREDGNYEYQYTIVISQVKISATIEELKQQLSATDYKVIKNMEAQMLGLDLPYNPTELNFERQPLRDKINELEKLLEDRGVVAQ